MDQRLAYGQKVGLAVEENGIQQDALLVITEEFLKMLQLNFVSTMETQTPNLFIQIHSVDKHLFQLK